MGLLSIRITGYREEIKAVMTLLEDLFLFTEVSAPKHNASGKVRIYATMQIECEKEGTKNGKSHSDD